MSRMVEWESPFEADAIRLFEFNPGVRAFYSQPSVEHYHDAFGTARSFIPDFRVDWLHGGSLLVEVKSDADAAYPPTQHLLGLKAMAMQLQGKPYRVLTPTQIKSQVTFAWFDAHRDVLLRATNRLTPEGYLMSTLGRSSIDKDIRSELLSMIPSLWPDVWAEAVAIGVQSTTSLSGAPIAEYLPERLVSGPLAIVGDAAHVVSPMTGSGFATGVDDAALLSRALAERRHDESMAAALLRYENARLPYTRALVAHSRQLSARYVNHASGVDLVQEDYHSPRTTP